MQAPSDFQVRLDAAREWEKRMAALLRERGWYVLPTYDFSGKGDDKAPKLMAPVGCESLVLPDLQCFGEDGQRWVEVKYKTRADYNRKHGYTVTGISRRLWRHYRSVAEVSRADVFVAFLHDEEAEIRGDSLANLSSYVSHEYDGSKMGRDGMVFWRYGQIPRWCQLDRLPEAA